MKTLFSLGLVTFGYLGALQTCLAACYYPSHEEAPNDIPCDPTAEASPCCGGRASSEFGIVCLSNKLCLGSTGRVFRGSCTDKTWGSPNCPHFCERFDNMGELVSCRNVTKSDTDYCCLSGEGDCCDRGTGRFQLLPSNPQTTATWDVKSSRYNLVAPPPSTISSSTSRSTAISSDTTSSPTGGTSTTSTAENSQKTSSNAPASTGTGPSVDNPPSSTGLSTGSQVGIGVGVAGGVVFLAVLTYLFWKFKKAQKMTELEYSPDVGELSAPLYQHVKRQTRLVEMDAQGEAQELPS